MGAQESKENWGIFKVRVPCYGDDPIYFQHMGLGGLFLLYIWSRSEGAYVYILDSILV